MKYGSVCSGIEAASAAWHCLGWQPSFFSEIEAFPRAVLAHHYPDVPLHGDFTTIPENEYEPIDLLVGGTPCQSFSVAGLRGGLDDDRGNLALEFCRLAQRLRPRWIVWENVPGVLSSGGGRDFGSILGALEELGYGFAYRVLDAQYFGVAQRRRRVFVVGYLGDWRRAAAVLFERHSMSGHPAPRRKTGEGVAALTATGVGTCGADDNQGQAGHLIAWSKQKTTDPKQIISFSFKDSGNDASDNISPTLRSLGAYGANGGSQMAVAYDMRGREGGAQFEGPHDTANIRAASGGSSRSYVAASAVRRLTPVECERLQGFPDNFTAIPWRKKGAEDCPDGPRYKALGNSMAVPVMRWIGERIAAVEAFNAS